jgi:hypothetical protein
MIVARASVPSYQGDARTAVTGGVDQRTDRRPAGPSSAFPTVSRSRMEPAAPVTRDRLRKSLLVARRALAVAQVFLPRSHYAGWGIFLRTIKER